jgi:hypothetical protein
MSQNRWSFLLLTVGFLFASSMSFAQSTSRVIPYYGYDDCILLENDQARVVLCPAAGGRVLEYSRDGKNALYLPPGEEGWTYAPGKSGGGMNAGRFDIGPELTIAAHPSLWKGPWNGEITGALSARLTSKLDQPTGVRLVRDFELDPKTSRLECRQTIENVSNETVEYCHWSRTFALGGGICVIPTSQISRFPNHYVMYEEGALINARPVDDKIRARDGFLEVLGAPRKPKLGFDSREGWMAYAMPNDFMFVKAFRVYPDRVYNEVAGLTVSVWYPEGPMCELEPIGPMERLKPGESAAFTETWLLLPQKFPAPGQALDLGKVHAAVKSSLSVSNDQ